MTKQAPSRNKLQFPISNSTHIMFSFGNFVFGNWRLFGACDLELGIFFSNTIDL
jgi:hypothetical protein